MSTSQALSVVRYREAVRNRLLRSLAVRNRLASWCLVTRIEWYRAQSRRLIRPLLSASL